MTPWLHQANNAEQLMADFLALCAFGGRRSGSGQDAAAMQWAMAQLADLPVKQHLLHVPYDGWHANRAELALHTKNGPVPLPCNPLLRSQNTPTNGLQAQVLNLGQGREEDFQRAAPLIAGKAVLVEHEYPFSSTHMHRRKKYDLAVQHGASAFLIANNQPDAGVLSGSSGRGRGMPGIPAAYISHEAAEKLRLAAQQGTATISLNIQGTEQENATACVGLTHLTGGRPETIYLSAHMDGHDLAQSALDNATGVAVALAAARLMAPYVNESTPSLCIAFFCAEEWALAGSAQYLNQLSPQERDQIKLNINLDTVAGDDVLTALISDFPALESYVTQSGQNAGVPIASWLPFMPNSDHANFARHGIPALRLVAGFNRPHTRVNNILSPGDLPGIVKESELKQALAATCGLVSSALSMSSAELNALAIR